MSLSASHSPPFPQPSILVVDDDPHISMALIDLFGKQGHEVSGVGTGTECPALGKKLGTLDIPGAYASLAKPYKVQKLTATVGRALCYSIPGYRNNPTSSLRREFKTTC